MGNQVDFYTTVLGMTVQTYADNRVALTFGQQKINLHQQGHEFLPKAKQTTSGAADLCFISETELDLAIAEVRSKGIVIIEGPVKRTGAIGPIISFYFRDPDGNLIEVANYE